MKNKVFNKLICFMFAVSLCFSYFALSASAQSLTDELVEFSCAEPSADSNNGYMVIFYKTATNKIMGRVISWHVAKQVVLGDNGLEDKLADPVSIRIQPSSIEFEFTSSGSAVCVYSLIDIISDTNNINGYSSNTFTTSVTYTASLAGNQFLGYALYGNGFIEHNTYPTRNELYPVLFNDSKTQYNQMLQLLSLAQQLGIKLDDVNANILETNAWLTELYLLLADQFTFYLSNIEEYSYYTQKYLLECRDLLIEIRDSLNLEGPSFEDTIGDDEFAGALGDYNAGDAVGSLPNQFEGDKGKIYSGIGFFTNIYDGLLHRMPELNHAITFILTISFAGYVLGRKLNKEG